jgi:hypothetical protein
MGDRVSVSGVRVRGPLAEYAAGFAEFVAGQGYAPGSVHLQVQAGGAAEPRARI